VRYRAYCSDEDEHRDQARDDFRHGGRYGYDREKYRDSFDACNEAYTEEFDRLRREDTRREEREEEERSEQRAAERRAHERAEYETAEAERIEQYEDSRVPPPPGPGDEDEA
jgi:hypothetical protein